MVSKVIRKIFKLFFIYVVISCLLSWTLLVYLSKLFTEDPEVLNLTKIYLFILGVFFIFFGINFFYSQVFQVTWYHKFRILTNIALVVLIWVFEYIFYNFISPTFKWIWFWWLLAQILMALVGWWLYRFYVSKKLINEL